MRVVRFVLVGGLNAAFGYGVFALGVLAGLSPEAALLGATVLGVAFNFMTTGRLVFGGADRRAAPRFVLAYVGVYILNAGALRVLVLTGVSAFLAQAVLVPASAAVTFVLMKTFVFPEKLA